MRPVKPGIQPIKLLGKDHHVPIIRLGDEGNPFHLTEVLRLGQGDPNSISRVRAIGDEVLSVQQGHAWILNAELFIGSERAVSPGNEKGLWISREAETIRTACQADDGPSGAEMRTKKHDVFVPVLHDRRVVNRFHGIRDLGLGEDGVVAIPSDDVWSS